MRRGNPVYLLVLCTCLVAPFLASAQLDPEYRRLIQLGYNQPVEGRGPIAAYGFFYYNQPNFYSSNLVLRAAIAPVYLDSELGFKSLLGPHTDFGIGVAGGGFADSYSEIRRGQYLEEESFLGHGASLSFSVYHLFNPDQRVPLNLVVRATGSIAHYEDDDKTDPAFVLPEDRESLKIRTGLRWGGEEPSLTEPLAMEVSVWEESQFRNHAHSYGFADDRLVEADSHLIWARTLLKYTFKSEHLFEFSITAGTSIRPDRFSAYRLGGVLPFATEFPLNLPGYYYQEISAERFVQFDGQYSFPLTPKKNLRLSLYGGGARVDYLDGLEQPGGWHSGAGGGLTFISPHGAWIITALYAHGFNALRKDEERGANQVGLIFQWDMEAKKRGKSRFFTPEVNPYGSRGGERLFR